MVKACSAPGCRYQYRKGDNVKMHSFPANPNLNQQWVEAMNKENFNPSKFSVICGQHFLQHDYTTLNGKLVLKRLAVPSIFYESKSIRPVVYRFEEVINDTEEVEAQTDETNIDEENDNSCKECFTVEIVTQEICDYKDESLLPGFTIEIDNAADRTSPTNEKVFEENVELHKVVECNEEEDEIFGGEQMTEYDIVDSEDDIMSNEEKETVNEHCNVLESYNIEKPKPASLTTVTKFPRIRKQPHFMGDFIYEDLEDPVQRKKYWLMSHKVVEIQKRKLRYWCSKRRAMEKKIESLSRDLEVFKALKGKARKKKLIYVP